MSYDLAVWEGSDPSSDAEASSIFERLMSEFQDAPGEAIPPTARIADYVSSLLSRWPDIADDNVDDSPWADGPLINNATGPILYFTMRLGRADEVVDHVSRTAANHGLICYDPQAKMLL